MSTRTSMPLSTIYRWPLLVAVVIALGLAAALAGDGIARVISWIALACPIGLIAGCLVSAIWRRNVQRTRESARTTAFQQ
jgi:hypothetical protein